MARKGRKTRLMRVKNTPILVETSAKHPVVALGELRWLFASAWRSIALHYGNDLVFF